MEEMEVSINFVDEEINSFFNFCSSEDEDDEFGNAFRCKDIEIMKTLISAGKVCLSDSQNDEYLYKAMHHKNLEMVEFLLSNGINPDVKDPTSGVTALGNAINEYNPSLVKILLDHNADVTRPIWDSHRRPLDEAIFLKFTPVDDDDDNYFGTRIDKIVDLILEHGMRSKNENHSNYYKLCSAILKNDVRAAKDIVKLVDDVNFPEILSENPVKFAAMGNRLEIAELLLRNGANPNEDVNLERESAIFAAISSGNLEMVALFCKFKVRLNFNSSFDYWHEKVFTPLCFAVRHGVKMVKLLVDQGANIKGLNKHDLACSLHVASALGSYEVVKFLLENNADVNVRDRFQNTPLDNAINHPEVVKLLLENGADIDPRNSSGQTPLHRACAARFLTWRNQSLELLLDAGADLSAIDEDGKSVLHYAAFNEKTFFEMVKLAIGRGVLDVNEKYGKEKTTLLHFVQTRCLHVVEVLKWGGDLNVRSGSGKYLIHYHADNTDCPVIEYVQRLLVVGFVVENDTKFFQEIRSGGIPRRLEYEKELEELRGEVIAWNPRKSLCDLLFMNLNTSVRYFNWRLKKAYMECGEDFETKYPFYGSLVNARYRRCEIRSRLVEAVKSHIEREMGLRLPEPCYHKIFRYFCRKDLEVMCEV